MRRSRFTVVKLTDCESEDIRENELFLVEGDSAGGPAKLARKQSHPSHFGSYVQKYQQL